MTKDRRNSRLELQRQRETLMQSVDATVLNTYKQISKFRKGISAGPCHPGLPCQACHVRIRPHVVSQVIGGRADHYLRAVATASPVLEAGCSLRSDVVVNPSFFEKLPMRIILSPCTRARR